MQQQRTSGSRRNVNQRLDDIDYICFTIQHVGIMDYLPRKYLPLCAYSYP